MVCNRPIKGAHAWCRVEAYRYNLAWLTIANTSGGENTMKDKKDTEKKTKDRNQNKTK